VALPRVRDDLRANRIVMEELYDVTGPFEADSNGRPTLQIDADHLYDYLKEPDSIRRRAPLALDFPVEVEETTRVLLPTPWDVRNDTKSIDGPGFHYESQVRYADDTATISYRFRTLADHVSPEQMRDFGQQLSRVRNDVGFQLYTGGNTQTVRLTRATDRPWAPLAVLVASIAALLTLRQLLRMRFFLTVAVHRVRATPVDREPLDPGERLVLESLDDELRELDFVPLGYVAHTPWLSHYEGSEHVRLFRHLQEPILAVLRRRPAPELGRCTYLTLETRTSDGRTLATSNLAYSGSFAGPTYLSESVVAATARELLVRHRMRVAVLSPAEILAPPSDLPGAAALLAAWFSAMSAYWHSQGWCADSADPSRGRITLRGAWYLGLVSAKAYGKRGSAAPVLGADSDSNRRLRIEAELLAVRQLASSPRSAPGVSWGLVFLMVASALVSVASMWALWGLTVAVIVIATLLLHEGGLALAMRVSGHRHIHVFFLPLLGAVTIGNPMQSSVRSRVAVLLAGPTPGVILAVVAFVQFGPTLHGPLLAAVVSLLFINGFNLLPFSPLDGGRVVEALSHPDSVFRVVWQLATALALFALAVKLGGSSMLPLILVSLVLIPGALRTWRLRRAVATRLGAQRNRASILRAAVEEMAQARYAALRSPLRQARAQAVLQSFEAPVAERRDRLLGIVAYGVSAAIAAWGWALWLRMPRG
jgi:Zn-dependent protease